MIFWSFFCLQKLVDEGSDEFQRALYTAIRGIKDPIKYYEKVWTQIFLIALSILIVFFIIEIWVVLGE